jgi:hypothetical protein
MLIAVIVSFLEDPARVTRLVGLADRANPGTVMRTWMIFWRLPLAPKTVTLYAPAGVVEVAEIVRTELPDPLRVRATLVGLRDAVVPCGVATESETLPEKPPVAVRTIVVVFVLPGGSIREDGEADNVKSCMLFTRTVPEATPTVPRESVAER